MTRSELELQLLAQAARLPRVRPVARRNLSSPLLQRILAEIEAQDAGKGTKAQENRLLDERVARLVTLGVLDSARKGTG